MTPMGFAVEIIAAIKRTEVIVHKMVVFVKTFNICVDCAVSNMLHKTYQGGNVCEAFGLKISL